MTELQPSAMLIRAVAIGLMVAACGSCSDGGQQSGESAGGASGGPAAGRAEDDDSEPATTDATDGAVPPQATARAAKAYDELVHVTKYGPLSDLVEHWKKTVDDPTLIELVARLTRGLSSQTACSMQTDGRIAIASRVQSGEITPERDAVWMWQDILIEGGRCAWALERLLECDLPPITSGLTDEQRQAAIAESRQRIEKAMRPPRAVNVSALPLPERLKFATSENSHPRVLTKLAEDESVEVRRAVAANRYTPPRVQKKMYDDEDPQVRQLAQQSFLLIPPPRETN